MKKLNYIDLFAGCGGLSDGFEQTSFYQLAGAVEWELSPCRTFMERLKTKWGYKQAEKAVLRFDMQRTKELLDGYFSSVTLAQMAGGFRAPVTEASQ